MDASAVARQLRVTDTVAEGRELLSALRPSRADLLAVAGELGLTRVERLSGPQLTERVLRQAIGARRKYEGLRRW